MPYPERLIQDGEDVALDLRPHWWYFSRNILTGVPLLVIAILALQVDGDVGKYLAWLVAVLVVIWAGWLGLKYLDWSRTYFVVTDRRVVYRTGVLSKKGVEIPHDRISNINFAQTLWERMIGAGNLDIESAGRDGESHFDFVRHPDGVQHEIYRQMDRNEVRRAGLARGGADGSGANVAEQIEQLARLHDRGLVTDDEFERKRQELLRRL
jgi:uncharacterized membrane protein YdbT with pleckstrin-like domain